MNGRQLTDVPLATSKNSRHTLGLDAVPSSGQLNPSILDPSINRATFSKNDDGSNQKNKHENDEESVPQFPVDDDNVNDRRPSAILTDAPTNEVVVQEGHELQQQQQHSLGVSSEKLNAGTTEDDGQSMMEDDNDPPPSSQSHKVHSKAAPPPNHIKYIPKLGQLFVRFRL
ncbi:hypothetical protein IV203_026305 [Nitzschia inconspicua]|uniref:Uncharacterized protein n=1 Tax=Nitzschia inconspicua TaxID=303405 RepID=A0A9K3LID6_9STRA|nr:hypothetical protein IV203_026305 [Nitzschia inconspicua]